MKTAFLIVAFTSVLSGQTFDREFRDLADSFGGRIGVAARHMGTGETVLYQADSLFPTASVIKLPVLVELMARFHDGTLDPDKPVMLADSLKKPGSGILQFISGGQTLRLIDIATMMIVVSDNTGTNYVIDRFGDSHDRKLEAVNDRMRSLGLRNTKLLNKVYSFATKKKTEEARRFGIGVTSPGDMLLLLDLIVQGRAVGRTASDSIIAIMKNQTDNQMAQRYLPFIEDSTLWIGNKTGSLDEVKNDVGIVGSSKGMYIYAIFCSDSKDVGEQVDNRATLAVARASRLLYDHFLGKK